MFSNFGERLKESLKNTGYTVTKITEELGFSKNVITNYFNGRIPTGENLYKLSQFCGKSMEYLLTGKDTSNLTQEEQKIIEMYNQLTEKNKGKIELLIEQKIEEQQNEIKSSVSTNTENIKVG